MKPLKKKIRGSTIVVRVLLFSLLWWVLSDGVLASWLIGVPAVLLAVAASVSLLPPMPVAWFEVLKFVPLFLRHSLLGGVDVAQRVFQPRMPIDPDLVEYPLRLPSGLPQVFMANIVSLLPGTLSAALDRNVLTVHVLDRETGFLAELQMVEQRVALMLDLSLNNPVKGKRNEKVQ